VKAVFELPSAHGAALRQFINTISPKDINWVLTGSAGLRLQGVDVTVGDLEVESDKLGMKQILERFEVNIRERPYLKETNVMLSYFTVIEVNGVMVELIGDIQPSQPDGS